MLPLITVYCFFEKFHTELFSGFSHFMTAFLSCFRSLQKNISLSGHSCFAVLSQKFIRLSLFVRFLVSQTELWRLMLHGLIRLLYHTAEFIDSRKNLPFFGFWLLQKTISCVKISREAQNTASCRLCICPFGGKAHEMSVLRIRRHQSR